MNTFPGAGFILLQEVFFCVPNQSSTLFIKTSDGSPSDDEDDVFVIDEELREVSNETYDEVYSVVTNADVDSGLPFSFYEIFWPGIVNSQDTDLVKLILVYIRLSRRIEKGRIDRIEYATLDQQYVPVIRDVADQYAVEIDYKYNLGRTLIQIRGFIIMSLLIIPFFADQLFSIIWRRTQTANSEVDTIFVPSLRRLTSMLPIIKRATFNFGIAVTPAAARWITQLKQGEHSEITHFDPFLASGFSSWGAILLQLHSYLILCKEVVFTKYMISQLQDEIYDSFDIKIENTISYCVRTTLLSNPSLSRSILSYYIYKNMFEKTDCRKVVVGALNTTGRSVVIASIENGVKPYHIPHSIATAQAPNPPEELTQFVSGSLDIQYYKESEQVKKEWVMVATGRPYLTELYNVVNKNKNLFMKDSCFHVLIATQPFREEIRSALVKDTVTAVQEMEQDVEIIIKTHPSEDSQFYKELAEGYDLPIKIATTGLHKHIRYSDLTITINSNVGLESMVIGTPCVCLNKWEPIIQTMTYARYGQVPTFKKEDELIDFFHDIKRSDLKHLRKSQTEFVSKNYILESDAATNIIEYL